MNETAIEMICQKLGTTVENIIPAVIEYCTHNSEIGLAAGIILIGISVVSMLLAVRCYRKDEDGILYIIFTAIAVIGSILGIIFTIVPCYDLHMIIKFPEMYAYKTIIRWINGT